MRRRRRGRSLTNKRTVEDVVESLGMGEIDPDEIYDRGEGLEDEVRQMGIEAGSRAYATRRAVF